MSALIFKRITNHILAVLAAIVFVQVMPLLSSN
jgi:hypothetical protein